MRSRCASGGGFSRECVSGERLSCRRSSRGRISGGRASRGIASAGFTLGVVADDREEGTPNEVFDRRDHAPASQKLLRRESDERPTRALVGLGAQHVEMVGRGGRLADPHVVLRT